MNPLLLATIVIVAAGAITLIIGSALIMLSLRRQPYRAEIAPARGSPAQGVIYAFTLGMAPWSKESARRHKLAYIRGVLFHIGIFVSALFLITSPLLVEFPIPLRVFLTVFMAIGAVMVFAGFGMRLTDPIMRRLSTPDDYFSLTLVTLLLASGSVAAAQTAWLPLFFFISGLTMAYMPFGKLRHFIFFFYERIFFGLVFGRRGVLGWKHE